MAGMDAWKARWKGRVPGLSGCRHRYAVLCPLAEIDGEPHFLFEVRAASLNRQPGEVCFPGGEAGPGEEAAACALRETWEELHIAPEHVAVLGLSDFLCFPSKFLLQPVVGILAPEGLRELAPSPDEVAGTFTAPVSFFASTPPDVPAYSLEPRLPEDFPYETAGISRTYRWGRGSVDVPIWRYREHVIWGMTARIIRDLLAEMQNS